MRHIVEFARHIVEFAWQLWQLEQPAATRDGLHCIVNIAWQLWQPEQPAAVVCEVQQTGILD